METTQWKPGMPVKGFDPYNIDRVKADLADGSCTEFPLEDYKEYLIEKVRENALREGIRDFTVQPEPLFNKTIRVLGYAWVEEINAFRDGCKSFDEDIEKYVTGNAYITYVTNPYCSFEKIPLLLINIGVGNDTGFDNPIFVRAAYKITWIGPPVFDDNEDSDREW
jgi:hypothetical protein